MVVNGCPLGEGAGICDDQDHLLLTTDALTHGLGLTVVQDSPGGPWTVRGFGRSVVVRPDNTSYQANGELRSAEAGPVLRDGAPAVPLEMLASLRPEDTSTVYAPWCADDAGRYVTDVRQGSHDDSVRLVLDLSAPTGFTDERTGCWLAAAPRADSVAGGGDWCFDDPWQAICARTNRVAQCVLIADHWNPPAVHAADPPRVVIDPSAPENGQQARPTPTAPPIAPECGDAHRTRGPMRYVINVDPRWMPSIFGPCWRRHRA